MILIREGSIAYDLLRIMSAAGEFPVRSLSILNDTRSIGELVHRLENWQDFEVSWSGKQYHAKLICVSGKRGERNMRLHKSALPMLDELYKGALAYYMSAFRNHAFSGKRSDIERNHRVAETMAMMMAAEVDMLPGLLPKLQAERIQLSVERPCFYPSRIIKRLDGQDSMNKTGFTRMTGLLLAKGLGYVLYNTRGAVMKWHGGGEIKAMQQCTELARKNASVSSINGAILLGHDGNTAFDTLLESGKARLRDCSFDRVYQHIHFVPLNSDGKLLLKMLLIQNLQEKLCAALFPQRLRVKGYAELECDAIDSDKYILSHLDGDVARLGRFRLAAYEDSSHRFEAICYPWQLGYVKPCLGGRVELRCIEAQRIFAAIRRE